jgi:tripartite-type tricarboxylate transporter receptor subunit TctC
MLARVCVVALALACGTATAQTYPTKAVRLIVPAAPGGGLDLVARAFAAKLPELWGQQVIVENRPGANFIVGTDAVAKAAPDGYTLLYVSSSALTINPVAYPDLPYQPRDLVPAVTVNAGTFVLVLNPSVPANSVQEFVAYLRGNPGKLNHASNSTSTMLASEMFKALARVDYADINFKGGALAASSTAAGDTQFAFVDIGSAIGHVRSGRLRLIAVTKGTRTKLQPEVPTVAEGGVPGYAITPLTLVMLPARTPGEIVARINADMVKVLSVPETVARIEATGTDVVTSTAEEATRLLRAESDQWARLIRERNIKLQ